MDLFWNLVFFIPFSEGRVSLNKHRATCSGREKINTKHIKLTQNLPGCVRENKKNCSTSSPHTETWQQLEKLGSAQRRSCRKQDLTNTAQKHTPATETVQARPSEMRNDGKLTKISFCSTFLSVQTQQCCLAVVGLRLRIILWRGKSCQRWFERPGGFFNVSSKVRPSPRSLYPINHTRSNKSSTSLPSR